ncbi:MAG: PAAR domain-containing protein [Chloroflexi bacterium]|nr:PAAR domain-containing protein [Chloroflexota bacterium]
MPGQPAAKQNDTVIGVDTHIVMVPSPGGPVPTPTPGHPFNGIINGGLSSNVKIMGQPAATLGSTAQNTPPHIPMGGPSFQVPPLNRATITQGSATVLINGKPAARNGDPAQTCDDLVPAPHGTVVAVGTILIG